tara:strand:- start:42 stop:275 length:234 start_codon:yes stop_codon:yes gene_type:complete
MTKDNQWPGWFYSSDGDSMVFQKADEVPTGWFTTPQEAAAHAFKSELDATVKEIIDAPASIESAPIKPKRPYNRKVK